LTTNKKIISDEKNNLHPRNPHRFRYNFSQLVKANSALKNFVFVNKFKNETIDFSNADAVLELNKSLLNFFYKISYWNIPKNYLCPPIPGRADYIHNIADLLSSFTQNKIVPTNNICILDIGVGANCIYPLIGTKEYNWKFVGSDIDSIAIASAKKIVKENFLQDFIELRLQKSATKFFNGIVKPTDFFDVTICNPPFHSSLSEAQIGTKRKWNNLHPKNSSHFKLNFGGQHAELCCEGGEELFIRKMIRESVEMKSKCFWFTSLVSKSYNLPKIYKEINQVNVTDLKTFEMSQGNKKSRIVAWTFLSVEQQSNWKQNHT